MRELEELAATPTSSGSPGSLFPIEEKGSSSEQSSQQPTVRLTFSTFRVLVSIMAHRLALARKHELYHEVFRFFDVDSGGTLDEVEMENVAIALGRKFTSSEIRILKNHADEKGGIGPADFVQAMHAIDASERRQKLLESQNLKEERYEKAFELHKTDGTDEDSDFLDAFSYRIATSSLGLLWSMKDLDLARDTSEQTSLFDFATAITG